MTLSPEIVAVLLTAVLGLQAWTLKAIVSLKVEMARVQDLKERIEKLEKINFIPAKT